MKVNSAHNAANLTDAINAKLSKPEKLARIVYAAIVRYVKAKGSRIGEKNRSIVLDFSRERRVNMVNNEFD